MLAIGFEIDAGIGHHASRRARKLEQGLRRKQLFFGLRHGGLLARRLGRVLEANDVGTWHLKLKADTGALDGEV
jgi:hypothetical protein